MSQVRARVVILEVARRCLGGVALEMEQIAIFSVCLTTRPPAQNSTNHERGKELEERR